MSPPRAVVGLEVHAQLRTATKLFSRPPETDSAASAAALAARVLGPVRRLEKASPRCGAATRSPSRRWRASACPRWVTPPSSPPGPPPPSPPTRTSPRATAAAAGSSSAFFVGEAMRRAGGRVEPRRLRQAVEDALGAEVPATEVPATRDPAAARR